MKKILLTIMALAISHSIFAQSDAHRTELGVSITGLSSGFGVVLRTGNDHALWRISIPHISLDIPIQKDTTLTFSNTSQISLGIGREWRKQGNSPFFSRFGFDINGTVNHMYVRHNLNQGDANLIGWEVGFNAVLGLGYQFKDHWVFGGELNPGISYYSSPNLKYGNQAFERIPETGIQLTTSSIARLTVAYKF